MPFKRFLFFLILPVFLVFGFFLFSSVANAGIATSNITVSICGDGNVAGNEVCDDGPLNNGGYQLSILDRKCNLDCSAYGPHCGDHALHSAYGETCDDGNNNSLDGCSAICQIEAVSPGGGGGGSGPFIGGSIEQTNPTKVVASGKAYPNSDVRVLKDGEVMGIVRADTNADFSFTTTNITAGITTLGFWSEDSNGLKSTSFTITIRIISNAVTTIAGIYLPPTITLDKKSVKKGETLKISGTTVPAVDVVTRVNSEEEIIEKTKSKEDGSWVLDFDTAPLKEDDFHTAKAQFEIKNAANVITSGLSQAVSFFVGLGAPGTESTCGRSDINKDGKVNLVDFSILLFNWGTSNEAADINLSGKVDLVDFSIMLFCWTG